MRELPIPGNSTYIYAREAGVSKTENEAYIIAINQVLQNTATRLGLSFDKKKSYEILCDGGDYHDVTDIFNIPINVLDKYVIKLPNGEYSVWILCQVAASSVEYPIWDRSKKLDAANNFNSMTMSVIPGLGQLHKGYVGEAMLTMVGEIALVGGATASYFFAQRQLDIMRTEGVALDDFVLAQKTYRTLQTTELAFWGAAGVLYFVNFVRAYTLSPMKSAGVAFVPSIISTSASIFPSVGLTLNF